MTTELTLLLGTTISIALFHTFIGIDHYVPFIALSQSNKWTIKKTMVVVFLCGLGHVLSSIILGFVGIGLSTGVETLVGIESMRGDLATYFLVGFGLVYMAYGIRRALKGKTHSHVDSEGNEFLHVHTSTAGGHNHPEQKDKRHRNVFWGLMILFVLGPCEPLIPLIMYPAANQNTFALLLVTITFAVCTIGVMMIMTILGVKGLKLLNIKKLGRYTHALAGGAIFVCGISLLLLPI
jgi:sulfite exporter TauE/SafE